MHRPSVRPPGESAANALLLFSTALIIPHISPKGKRFLKMINKTKTRALHKNGQSVYNEHCRLQQIHPMGRQKLLHVTRMLQIRSGTCKPMRARGILTLSRLGAPHMSDAFECHTQLPQSLPQGRRVPRVLQSCYIWILY